MKNNDSNKETTKVEVAEGKVLYNVVRNAFTKAGLIFYPNPNTSVSNNNSNNAQNNNNSSNNNNNNYHFEIKNDRAVLVWFDTIRDLDYFTVLKPWQVVNRLPQAHVICRKAPFVRIIQRIQPYYPQLYQFLPKSYILPIQKDQFIQAVAKHDRKHIIKPDNGSLGAGIIILDKKTSYSPTAYLAIAQEYVESYLIDQTKFDLRIYCLVSSINPLKVYVYRGGVARFCSQPVDSTDSVFSQLTNTAVNKANPNIQKIESITQMVNDVFEKLKTKDKVDIDALWKRIDKAITLTILAAYNYLLQGEEEVCKPCGYSRCFQILGFDVLLDQNLDPTIMEVNYRPSLETDTKDENAMKCDMLSAAMKIAAPLNDVQEFLRSKFINENNSDQHNGSFTISDSDWNQKVKDDFLNQIEIRLKNTVTENRNKFVQTYPCTYDDTLNKQYNEIIEKVKTFPASYENRFKLPVEMKGYTSYKDNNTAATTNSSTTKTNNIVIKKDTSSSHLPPISQKPNQPQQNKTQASQPNQTNNSTQPSQQIQKSTIQQTQPIKTQQQQQNQQTKTQQQQNQQTKTQQQQNQQTKTQQQQNQQTKTQQQQNQQNKTQQQNQQIKVQQQNQLNKTQQQQNQQNKVQQQNQQNKTQQQNQLNKTQQQIQLSKPQQQNQQSKVQQQNLLNKQSQQNKPSNVQPKDQQNNKNNLQQTRQNQPNSKVNINSSNSKPLFEVKEPSFAPTKRRVSNCRREHVNSSFPSDKLPYVSRPNSNKSVHTSSTQSMSKTINLNNPAKTTTASNDSISNAKSTGAIKSLNKTSSKISDNKDKVRVSKTNVRSNRQSSNRKPNIVRKAETLRYPRPQYSKV